MNRNRTVVSLLIILMVFLVLFLYLVMNLKSRNYGYEVERLTRILDRHESELNKLLVAREKLLDLGRVEEIVTGKLNYRVATPEQIIKVVVK
jgi:cell division protein FtsL